jgi:hypothetical protein
LGSAEAVRAGEEESVDGRLEKLAMGRVEQIEEAIIASSEGFFDDSDTREDLKVRSTTREDLHVTIRIAGDFYDFLEKYEEPPDAKEIDYMAGTIRSGMDQFYLLAYICRSIVREKGAWSFEPHDHWDLSALRERFMRGFEHLAAPGVSAADRLSSLFALTHLELVFMVRHFPSAIFADWPPPSRTWDETMELIRTMNKSRRDRTQGAS